MAGGLSCYRWLCFGRLDILARHQGLALLPSEQSQRNIFWFDVIIWMFMWMATVNRDIWHSLQ